MVSHKTKWLLLITIVFKKVQQYVSHEVKVLDNIKERLLAK